MRTGNVYNRCCDWHKLRRSCVRMRVAAYEHAMTGNAGNGAGEEVGEGGDGDTYGL